MSETVRVLCAWCNATIRAGDAAREASHGICVGCAEALHETPDEGQPYERDERRSGPPRS